MLIEVSVLKIFQGSTFLCNIYNIAKKKHKVLIGTCSHDMKWKGFCIYIKND